MSELVAAANSVWPTSVPVVKIVWIEPDPCWYQPRDEFCPSVCQAATCSTATGRVASAACQ